MRKILLTTFLAALWTTIALTAQNPPAKISGAPPTFNAILDQSLSGIEKQLVAAAEALPAEKYDFVPTNGEFKGVRSFSQLLKHTAATTTILAAALQQVKPATPPEQVNNGPDTIHGKDEIVQYLKTSFADAHKALQTINKDNATEQLRNPFNPKGPDVPRMRMALLILAHSSDEYGQVVEYLRMNGVIPPASR